MKHIDPSRRLRVVTAAKMSAACVVAGRLLLLSISLLLAVMPLTERLWDWDRFFRGGQDFELGLLSVAVVLCLALVLCHNCKQAVRSLLYSRLFNRAGTVHGLEPSRARRFRAAGVLAAAQDRLGPGLDRYCPVLQI